MQVSVVVGRGNYFEQELDRKQDLLPVQSGSKMMGVFITIEAECEVSGSFASLILKHELLTCQLSKKAFQRLCIDSALHS